MTVYFALALGSNRIKIGCCRRNVDERVRAHQRARGECVVLLATAHGGRRVESWWHQRHAASGQRGWNVRRNAPSRRLTEWFVPTPQLWADIAELIDQELPA